MEKVTIEFTDKGFFLIETVNRKKHRRRLSRADVLDLLRIKQDFDFENKLLLEFGETEIKVIETTDCGCRKVKYIDPDSLLELLAHARVENKVIKPLGMLPKRLVHLSFHEPSGEQMVLIYEPEGLGEFKTPEKNFGIIQYPNMLFLFKINHGKIAAVHIVCIKEKYEKLKMDSTLYYYPYAHVSKHNYQLCTGSIRLPDITSWHQLNSYPFLIRDGYHILSHAPGPNKENIPLEALLEKVSKKEISINDMLVETGCTLAEFIDKYM